MKWIFNKYGEAINLTCACAIGIEDNKVYITCGGHDIYFNTFNTEEKARACVRELVKRMEEENGRLY